MTLALSLGLLFFCLVLAALPLLRRMSPVEPSPFKLLLFSALLSPPLAVLVHGLVGLVVDGAAARWGALLCLGLSFLLPQPRAVRRAALGRAAWLALGCAGLAALGLARLLFSGEGAMRLGHDGLGWQVSLSQFLLAGGSLEQPWLAGAALECSPLSAWLVAGLAGLTGLGPALIFAALACWSCALVLLCLHLWSAALWRSERADLGVLFLALFGWGSWTAWSALPDPGGGWAVALARVTAGEPGAVLHSGMAWIRGGPGVLALAFGFGGLYAGSHALRHGAAPWPLLAGICLGLCLGIHPLFGAALVGVHCTVLLVAARLGGPRGPVLRRSLLEFSLPVLPSILLAWRYSGAMTPQRVLTPEASIAALVPGLGLALLALVGVWIAWVRNPHCGEGEAQRPPEKDCKILVLHLILMATSLGVVAYLADEIHQDHALFLRAAGMGLAVLGAGSFSSVHSPWGKRFSLVSGFALVACLFALVLTVSGLRVASWSGSVHERLAAVSFGIDDARGHLTHRETSARSQALGMLSSLDLAPGTVLALRTDVAAERLPPEPGISLAGVTAGIPLLVDLDLGPRHSQRLDRLQEVLLGRMHPGAQLPAFLMVPGRDVLVLVDEVDREASVPGLASSGPRGVDRALEASGLLRVVDLDGCAVYLWRNK